DRIGTEPGEDQPGARQGAEQPDPAGRPTEAAVARAGIGPGERSAPRDPVHGWMNVSMPPPAVSEVVYSPLGATPFVTCRLRLNSAYPCPLGAGPAGTVAIASSVAPAGMVSAAASNGSLSRLASRASTRWCMPSSDIEVLS